MIALRLEDLRHIPNSTFKYPDSIQIYGDSIRGISIDTRTLVPQEIFWAIKGESFDGHRFVDEAEKRGAVAVVAAKRKAKLLPKLSIPVVLVKDTLSSLQSFASWHRSRFKIPVIGLTGTNGKTTTKEMIAWILQTRFNVHKTLGNLNNHIGTPLTLLRLNSEHDISIVELGTNHYGEIEMLSGLVKPTGGLITNIGHGHLEFLKDLDGVAREKLALFHSVGRNGVIFLNRDDKKLVSARIRRKNTQDYSLNAEKGTKVKGKFIRLNGNGCGIWKLNDKITIRLQVPGFQNVQNALAASSVALYYGVGIKTIKAALEEYQSYDKRMQLIKNGQTLIINDTYNSNPDSFLPALQTLSHMTEKNYKRKLVVVGDMLELGTASKEFHKKLFEKMVRLKVNGIFTIGKNCRVAADHIREKGFEQVYSFKEQQKLAAKLKQYIKSGDVILIKGSRGMQMEKILAYL